MTYTGFSSQGRDELDKLVVAKSCDGLDELFVAKGHDELDELVVAKGRDKKVSATIKCIFCC